MVGKGVYGVMGIWSCINLVVVQKIYLFHPRTSEGFFFSTPFISHPPPGTFYYRFPKGDIIYSLVFARCARSKPYWHSPWSSPLSTTQYVYHILLLMYYILTHSNLPPSTHSPRPTSAMIHTTCVMHSLSLSYYVQYVRVSWSVLVH